LAQQAGALVYLFVSNVAPVPAHLPSELPTSGPSPTPTPTITPTSTFTPTPTITPTPTPAPYSIEIRNRTGDETIGERLASYLSDAGYNVVKVSIGSTITDFGNTFDAFRLWSNDLAGPERSLAGDICRILDLYCELWAGYPGDFGVMMEVGSIHDWDAWLSERGY
jgi:hypothetical protein